MKTALITLAIMTSVLLMASSVMLIIMLPKMNDASSTKNMGNEALVEEMVNEYRVSLGLGKLAHDEKLCKSALYKSADMLDKQYFAHVSPTGEQPWDLIVAQVSKYSKAGENLAFGNIDDRTIVDGWINSPGHRENMVGDFTKTCVKALPVSLFKYNGTTYRSGVVFTQHFATY